MHDAWGMVTMSKQQMYGLLVLCAVGINMIIGATVIFQTSWLFGIVYLVDCAFASGAILYAFCAKCPCKAHCCGHVLPGMAAKHISRKSGPYTVSEYLIVAASLLLILGLPQFWLWRHTALPGIFWGLAGLSMIPMRTIVCPDCKNVYCALRPGSKHGDS